jgi:hypothetical protein
LIRSDGLSFASLLSAAPTESRNETEGAAEHSGSSELSVGHVKDIKTALRFAREHPDGTAELTNDLQQLTGSPTQLRLRAQARKHHVFPTVGFYLSKAVKTSHVSKGWLAYECRRRAVARLPGAAEHVATELQNMQTTPTTVKELADALRDHSARMYMPFGKDFEDASARMAGETQQRTSPGKLLDGAVVARWLALFELQTDGFGYTSDGLNIHPRARRNCPSSSMICWKH